MNKKIWLLILSLCLVVFCSATAMADEVYHVDRNNDCKCDIHPTEAMHDYAWDATAKKHVCIKCKDDDLAFEAHAYIKNGAAGHVCQYCSMTEAHKWTSETVKEPTGTCQVPSCGYTCTHSWADGKCTTCGLVCQHSKGWENGKCKDDCKKTCDHKNENGTTKFAYAQATQKYICSTCQIECKHENQWQKDAEGNYTGKCICDYSHVHTTAESWDTATGTCKTCHAKCKHTTAAWANSTCPTCGYKCTSHTYTHTKDLSTCSTCGKTCNHIAADNKNNVTTKGYCDLCGFKCKHDDILPQTDEKDYCTKCGFEQAHVWVADKEHPEKKHHCANGCGLEFEHDFTKLNGQCEDCDYICMHNYVNNKCTICDVCKHDWKVQTNGTSKCAICQKECKHDQEGIMEETLFMQGTCTTANVYKLTCKLCKKDCGFKVSEEFNHNYQDGVIAETCTNPAMQGTICTECNAVKAGTQLTALEGRPALGHNWVANENWYDSTGKKVYVAPTCDKDGYGYMYCARCNKVDGERAIPKLGHNWNVSKEIKVDVTCTVDEHWANPCTRCNATNWVRRVDGGKIHQGHKEGTTVAKVAANCVDKGYENVTYCSVCGAVTNRGKEIPAITNPTANEHKNVQVQYVLREGDCTTSRIEKVKCVACNKYEDYKVTPAVHTWKKNADYVAATCGAAGSGTQTCEKCGVTVKVNEPATGNHVYSAVDIVRPETCTHPEQIGKFCTVCNADPIVGGIKDVPDSKKAPHKYIIDTAKYHKDPTCGKAGEAYVMGCATCDEVKEGKVTLPATGAHAWGPKQKIPATCTKVERVGITCTVCGAIKDENGGNDAPTEVEGSKLAAHNFGKVVTGGTCKEPNQTTEYKCSACGQKQDGTTTETVLIAKEKRTHDLKVTVIRAATCKTPEVVRQECNNTACDYGTQYKVKSVGHKWDDSTKVVVKAATCGAAGEGKYKCSLCGEEGKYTIDATGKHNFQPNQIKEATCTANAQVGTFCTVCWANYGNDAQDITGTQLKHNPVIDKDYKDGAGNVIYVAPTCDKTGIGYQYCTLCGKDTKVVVIPALGHKFGAEIVNEAGTALYHICGVCGYRELVKVFNPTVDQNDKCALFGHSETVIPAIAATCTTTGKTAGLKCSVCDKVLTAQTEIGALGHNFADGVCTVCGAKDPNYVPHVHKYTKKYSFNADFTKRVVTSTCECGDKVVTEEDF